MNQEEEPTMSGSKEPNDNVVMTDDDKGKTTTSTASSTILEGHGSAEMQVTEEISDSSSDSTEPMNDEESTKKVNSVDSEHEESTSSVPITTSSPPEDLEAELKQVLFDNACLQLGITSVSAMTKLIKTSEGLSSQQFSSLSAALKSTTNCLIGGTIRSGTILALSLPIEDQSYVNNGGRGGGGGGGGQGGVRRGMGRREGRVQALPKPTQPDGFLNKAYLDYVINPDDIDPAGGPATFNLENANSSCYLATISISALTMPDLVKALCEAKKSDELEGRPLQHAFYDIFQRLLCPNVKFTMDMTNIKKGLDTAPGNFLDVKDRYTGTSNERDPTHVWTHVFAALEQESGLNGIPYPIFHPFPSNDSDDTLEQIQVLLSKHRQENVIRGIFGTFIVTTQQCQSCNNRSHTLELLKLFNLAIPPQTESTAKSPLSISDLVKWKLQQLSIDDYECTCQEGKKDASLRSLKTKCTQTALFASFPSVVVFSLQRAVAASATQRTEQKSFERIIPEEFIELTSLNEGSKKFVLVSVSIHSGKGDKGHYVTVSRFKGKYYFFNDAGSRRTETTLANAFGVPSPFYVDLSRNALIFYYAQVAEPSDGMVDN